MTAVICPPDLTDRPHRTSVEVRIDAPVEEVYKAWTEYFDRWFAEPGAIVMTPEVNAPYFFRTHHGGRDHPHYGRFLEVDPPHRLRFTWVNEAGTGGVETVVTVEVSPDGDGTTLRLTHAGFSREKTAVEHGQAWRQLLTERLAPLVSPAPGRVSWAGDNWCRSRVG